MTLDLKIYNPYACCYFRIHSCYRMLPLSFISNGYIYIFTHKHIYVEREKIYVLLHFRYEPCRNVTWNKIDLMRICFSNFF
jgi:hypothetical protein